jgi:hypothetical protein
VAGGWRRLHNEELHDLCASLNIIKVIKIKEDEMGGACGTHEIRDYTKFGWKT